jgi:hypothetical protein
MMQGNQFARLCSVWVSLFLLLAALDQQIVLAASLRIEVRESLIDLQVQEVPLTEVLRAITEKTEVTLEIPEALADPVSCEIEGASLEEVVRRLLSDRSYVLTYRKTADGNSIPDTLQVLGRRGTAPAPLEPPHDIEIPKVVDRYWLEDQHQDLSLQLNAIPTDQGAFGTGILIKGIQEDSAFLEWGLKEGDVIDDVNGLPVRNREEFMQAFLKASRDHGMVRISRRTQDQKISPIYLHAQ